MKNGETCAALCFLSLLVGLIFGREMGESQGRKSLAADILNGKVIVTPKTTNTTTVVTGEIVDLYVEKP